MRLLPVRDTDFGEGAARPQPGPKSLRHRRRAGQASLSLRRAPAHRACGGACGRFAAQWEAGMTAPTLPASLIENPRLDRWIRFQPDRTVRIATGKVEIGQGVVTAIGQIAADELDVPLDRIAVLSGDTTHGPDELYTTSSLSIEMSGGSVRLVCAEVRAKALERAALRLNCSREELTVVDGQFLQNGDARGHDYWTVAPEIDTTPPVTGTGPGK